jgi:hypothetical protein
MPRTARVTPGGVIFTYADPLAYELITDEGRGLDNFMQRLIIPHVRSFFVSESLSTRGSPTVSLE